MISGIRREMIRDAVDSFQSKILVQNDTSLQKIIWFGYVRRKNHHWLHEIKVFGSAGT